MIETGNFQYNSKYYYLKRPKKIIYKIMRIKLHINILINALKAMKEVRKISIVNKM